MKALRVIGGLDPAFGGPSVSSVNSAIAAQRAGIATEVAYPVAGAEDARDVRARLAGEGIAVHEFALLPWPAGMARRYGVSPALARWLNSATDRFDIVHCHGAWVLPSWAVLRAAGRSVPCVLTPHESLTDFDIGQSHCAATRWAKTRLRPRYLARFDLVVFASALEARDSIPPACRATAHQAIVAHPVFDERGHRPSPRGAPTEGGLTVGFIGRLHAKKNVAVLLHALARLPAGVRLAVAGDGPEAERLRALAVDAGIAPRIDWLGFVQGEAKTAFFRRIDLLAMPSDYECFGVAAAEAMAEGRPVIVAPQTGVAETVGRHGGGLVVPPDATAVAGAIETFLHNPDALRQNAGRAAEAAGREFSFVTHGMQLRRAYEELVAAGRRQPQPALTESRTRQSRP